MSVLQIAEVAALTDGYSGADMATLCSEAAYEPIRGIPLEQIEHISAEQVRPISHEDFLTALQQVKPSVSAEDLGHYLDWNKQFGGWRVQ